MATLHLLSNMNFVTLFVLLISSIFCQGQNTSFPDCSGCTVEGVFNAELWTELYGYLNETVYVEVDLESNTTSELYRTSNPDASSSSLSLCSAALKSLAKNHDGSTGCYEGGVADVKWEVPLTHTMYVEFSTHRTRADHAIGHGQPSMRGKVNCTRSPPTWQQKTEQ